MSRTEVHPVEIALLAAFVVVEAVAIVASALAALVLAATSQKPVTSPPQLPVPPAIPLVHPLQVLATELQALTCRDLTALAGTRKRLNKGQLVDMVVAVGV